MILFNLNLFIDRRIKKKIDNDLKFSIYFNLIVFLTCLYVSSGSKGIPVGRAGTNE